MATKSADSEKEECLIENRTAYRIAVNPVTTSSRLTSKICSEEVCIIPPFNTISIDPAVRQHHEFDCWEKKGFLTIKTRPKGKNWEESSSPWLVVTGFAVLVIFIWLIIGIPLTIISGTLPLSMLLEIGIILGAFTFIMTRIFVYEHAGKQLTYAMTRIGFWFRRSPYVLVVLIIGWVLPGLTIYFLGEGARLMTDEPNVALLGRLIQFFFIGIAATFPAMMYLTFGRQKLRNVQDTFTKEILMLDPTILTLDEAESKYQVLMGSVYGSSKLGDFNQFKGAIVPLILSTLLITLGWILTLLPIGMPDEELLDLLTPSFAPIVFGFLGAYFFTINMVFRRYVRGDLTPKTYVHICFRLLVTTILVWTISGFGKAFDPNLQLNNGIILLFSFMIGVIPETGTAFIQEQFRRSSFRLPKSTSSNLTLDEEQPLTDLEGINIYDRARFQEEGINNIENLVYYDLVELIARTRVPTHRVIDVYDQAILYLYLGHNKKELDKTLQTLRKFGVRKATEFLAAYEDHSETFIEACDVLINSNSEPSKNGHMRSSPITAAHIKIIQLSLNNHEWMGYLQHWRLSKSKKLEAVSLEELTSKMHLTLDKQPIGIHSLSSILDR